MIVKSYISNIFDSRSAYIYIWFSCSYGAVYVGQTNSTGGVLSRAGSHVGTHGTLRSRFYDCYGERIESADDWQLLSFCLPRKKNYTSPESSFRLAVEYLVQSKMHEIRGDLLPPFRIISNVTYTDHCSNKEVVALSRRIVDLFVSNYGG